MHTRRLNRIARYLGSAGFYKEAYQMKKVAQEELEEDELNLAQQGLETNNEFEDLFPSSPDIMNEKYEDDEEEEGLSEYLDEEGMEPAGEERFDDEGFDTDSFNSLPHDDDDDSDLFESEDEDEDEDDEFEEMITDRAFRRGTKTY